MLDMMQADVGHICVIHVPLDMQEISPKRYVSFKLILFPECIRRMLWFSRRLATSSEYFP